MNIQSNYNLYPFVSSPQKLLAPTQAPLSQSNQLTLTSADQERKIEPGHFTKLKKQILKMPRQLMTMGSLLNLPSIAYARDPSTVTDKLIDLPMQAIDYITVPNVAVGIASYYASSLIGLIIHEFGHALAFGHFGYKTSIEINSVLIPDGQCNILTSQRDEMRMKRNPHHMMIGSLAGPVASGVTATLSAFNLYAGTFENVYITEFLYIFTFVNIIMFFFSAIPGTVDGHPRDGRRALMCFKEVLRLHHLL